MALVFWFCIFWGQDTPKFLFDFQLKESNRIYLSNQNNIPMEGSSHSDLLISIYWLLIV